MLPPYPLVIHPRKYASSKIEYQYIHGRAFSYSLISAALYVCLVHALSRTHALGTPPGQLFPDKALPAFRDNEVESYKSCST